MQGENALGFASALAIFVWVGGSQVFFSFNLVGFFRSTISYFHCANFFQISHILVLDS